MTQAGDLEVRAGVIPRTATLVAHEWIEAIGGAEVVLKELLDVLPGADVMCLWDDAPGRFGRDIQESVLAESWLRGRKALSLPVMPRAWNTVPLGDYQNVVVSSHAFAHHLAGRAAREGRNAHVYVHTPARYIWAPEVEIRGRAAHVRAASIPLKKIDRRATHSGVRYAANSEFIRERIQRSWDRDATVIYPPVDVERIGAVTRWRDALSAEEDRLFSVLPSDGYILGASRLVSYKRLDKAIEVGEALGMPVVIAGSGPEEAALRERGASATVPVLFTGRVSDEQLYALYQEASLFVFMPIEDFGIMPVECMAAGTPVLVNSIGGARESVNAVGLGAEAELDVSRSELAAAADRALLSTATRRDDATYEFSRTSFRHKIHKWIEETT
ncbi:glycosyltransferase [Nocardioides pinisoli]|uniref:Glycosyltransferase n=1 Tax=Nocardioides pinisoli TaxID=2950279 RepID=A0ABT1KT40_9ACTN|nr:glycosyltransferase [Nocardioides pinisoli]MCP3420916.1 glycosyltransferase [Nocardioides pinisoli]